MRSQRVGRPAGSRGDGRPSRPHRCGSAPRDAAATAWREGRVRGAPPPPLAGAARAGPPPPRSVRGQKPRDARRRSQRGRSRRRLANAAPLSTARRGIFSPRVGRAMRPRARPGRVALAAIVAILLALAVGSAHAARDTKLYKTLEISPDADDRTIQKAYRKLALCVRRGRRRTGRAGRAGGRAGERARRSGFEIPRGRPEAGRGPGGRGTGESPRGRRAARGGVVPGALAGRVGGLVGSNVGRLGRRPPRPSLLISFSISCAHAPLSPPPPLPFSLFRAASTTPTATRIPARRRSFARLRTRTRF